MSINSKIKIASIVRIVTYAIGLIGFGCAYQGISYAYIFSFGALFAISIYFEHKRSFLIPRWALNILSFGIIALSLMRLTLNDPLTPALEATTLLLAIKFLEDKRFRDYMQIYLISVFLLAGYALTSIDIAFLFYFLSLVFLISSAMVLLTYSTEDADMELEKAAVTKIVSRSLLIPLISIPTTLIIFVILPRTNYPLLSFLNKDTRASTGFTDTVRLGGISEIQQDNSTSFRVNMPKTEDRHLYWRGIVFDHFDGLSWSYLKRDYTVGVVRTLNLHGHKVQQTVYLEPYENRYLFALDKPAAIMSPNVMVYEGLTFAKQEGINRRLRYEAISYLTDVIYERDFDRQTYLQLPDYLPKEISLLTDDLTAGKDRAEAVEAVMAFLNQGDYKYSTVNLPISDTPLKDFLLHHKRGDCEYFASAMAVMLRSAGIPSRLVGGYKGGYYNEAGGYYLVLQRNAHVWVEAYLGDRGWVRFDPTPGTLDGFFPFQQPDMILRARILFDTINYYWNAVVVGYDIERQMSLFVKLRNPGLNMRLNRKNILMYAAYVIAGIAVLYAARYFFVKRPAPEEKIISLFLKRLKRKGYVRRKSEGLEEFAARIEDTELRGRAIEFAAVFQGGFYRDRPLTKMEIKKLRQLIRKK